jgi:LacI family transcriptional regulator
MGYRRDYRGVNLRTGRTNTLCAILSLQPMRQFGDPAAMHLMQGLIAGVEGTDLKLLIEPVVSEEEQLAALHDTVEAMRADGIIIDHTRPDDARVRYLIDCGVPFVTFGRTELAEHHAYLDIDNEHAAAMATSRLASSGHRRIALIDPPTHFLFSAQRRDGYLRALADANLPIDLSLVIETPINAENVAAATTALMALPDPPTALVLSNEVATLASVRACRVLGLDLNRIDFVSRDGTRLFDFFEPGVSSCYYPQIEAGRILSSMLIEAIAGAPFESLQRIVRSEFVRRR